VTSRTGAFRAFEHAGWQGAALRYDDAFGSLTRQAIDPLLDAAEARSGARVLDVASGPGYVAAAAAARGARVTGVDFSLAMVRLARAQNPGVKFRTGNAEALPFRDGSFDAVVMNFGMLHLARPDIARDTLAVFAQSMEDNGESMSALIQAAALYVHANAAFTVASAPAPQRPADPKQLAESVVDARTRWTSRHVLAIELTIRPPFHIQAHETASGLIATTLQVPPGAAVQYPAGELRRVEFADLPVRLYEGPITLTVTFDEDPSGAMNLALTFQPCDDTACLPPVTKIIKVPPPA